MNVLPALLLTVDPTPETSPSPEPEPAPSGPSDTPPPSPETSGAPPEEGSAETPPEPEMMTAEWTGPVETICGTLETPQDVCVHITPDIGMFFGIWALLVLLVLSALLASQLRRS